MNMRKLGKSELMVSGVSFGCMSLADDQNAATALLNEAADRGVMLFDTADLYQHGYNEEMVGKALQDRRQQVYIATKAGNQWRADGSGWDWNPSKAYIFQAVEESLRRLRTDYIDLYQLHGGTLDDPFEETIEAFEQLQQAGKIRYYGISSIRPNVIREYVARSQVVSVMLQYSLLDRRPEECCLDLLRRNSIGVLARGPVANGLLVNKPAIAYLGHSQEAVTAAAQAIASLSGEQRTPAQTALKFVIQQPAVTTVMVGIHTKQQLDDCLGVLDAPDLSPDEISALQAAVPALRYEMHR
ncbi:aldo/keto reductase [Candidatus Vecturithrix granuli]|uniref:Aldo/keto reductase n=1 Tax=Vecturithrix granuli TaxID=1499967 RepID=A0A081C1S7_VECG1|nr:aldo/keto reductase [Candidatus Vecturithrix granuli]